MTAHDENIADLVAGLRFLALALVKVSASSDAEDARDRLEVTLKRIESRLGKE
jgi:hypothetical protein